MSADSDSSFIKSFIVVLGGLVIFTFSVMYIARSMPPPVVYDETLIERASDRISPVGKVRTSADAPAADSGSDEATTAAAPTSKTPKELYDGVCGACHNTGVAGAPKLDDTAEWSKREAVGVDAMVATVVSGKGAMPPNGGSSFSSDEIKSIVEMLLGQ